MSLTGREKIKREGGITETERTRARGTRGEVKLNTGATGGPLKIAGSTALPSKETLKKKASPGRAKTHEGSAGSREKKVITLVSKGS